MRTKLERRTVLIAYSAVFTAIVFIFTVAFSLYIPETKGFFNIGESGVYLAALIGGPIVGAIAGGTGSMLADIFLGYYWYAPATFLIKAVEGFIAGYLARKIILKGKYTPRMVGSLASLMGGCSLYTFGTMFYLGGAEIYLQIPFLFSQVLVVELFSLIWVVLSAMFVITITYFILRDPGNSGLIISMMVAGIEMVLGYYLYEQFILGYAAIAEVPFNIMQMLIGTMVATYVYRGIRAIKG